jgi:hypothetical protein
MQDVGVHNWVADNTASARRSLVESVLSGEGLRGRVLAHNLTGADKRKIKAAYEACFNTQFKKTCSNCYLDAYHLIRNKEKSTIMAKCKYTLKAGANITWDNTFYNNTNLTDEVAEAFVAKFPTTKFFAVKPETIPDGPTGEMGHADPDGVRLDGDANGPAGDVGVDGIENLEGMTAEEIKKEKKRKADAARRERERLAKQAAQTDLT